MARRRRRRSTRKGSYRKTSRRAYSRRRNQPAFLPGRLGPVGKLLAAAVGYALAEIPAVQTEIGGSGIQYGAIVGGLLLLRGRGDTMKFIGLGMALNGGVAPAVSRFVEPIVGRLGAAAA